VAHRQLDVYIDGLRVAPATPLADDTGLSLDQLRAMRDRP
jgi:hypothetical protein